MDWIQRKTTFFFSLYSQEYVKFRVNVKKKKFRKDFNLKKARRKPFFRVKKNRAYRLLGSRVFNI